MLKPDIGNSHVIHWYLWQARNAHTYSDKGLYCHKAFEYINDPEDWSRYDGELL